MFPSRLKLGEGSSNPTPILFTTLLGSSLGEESAVLHRLSSATPYRENRQQYRSYVESGSSLGAQLGLLSQAGTATSGL
jgi:hypothetical protein